MTTQKEAWAKYPEHDGHNLGRDAWGNTVCKTCGFETVARGTHQPDHAALNEHVNPFWR